MAQEIFSNHIGNASELTVIADIKPGFVPIQEPLTYSARLRRHLSMLSALRRDGLETDRAGLYVGPIDSLRTLQFVRWTLIDDDTKMLLSVNFDQGLQPYIRRIIDHAGPLLDTILCHCEDFLNCSSDEGFMAFLGFVQRHQVPVELFAAAAPNMSVDDGDYFLEADKKVHASPLGSPETKAQILDQLAKLRMPRPKNVQAYIAEHKKLAALDQGLNIIRTMYERSDTFPATDFRGHASNDDIHYHNLTVKLVTSQFRNRLVSLVGNGSGHSSGRIPERVSELLTTHKEAISWFLGFKRKRIPKKLSAPPENDSIQSGLLSQENRFDGIEIPKDIKRATHACLLLLRVDDPKGGAEFLSYMTSLLWPKQGDTDRNWNLSITHNGLRSLGMSERERRAFPIEFREGMEARAGLLGDIDCNHPSSWTWPERNWPVKSGQCIAPSSVDLIIQVKARPSGIAADPVFDDAHPLFNDVRNLSSKAQEHGVTLLHVQEMQCKYNKTENGEEEKHVIGHLGFADGISQPEFVTPPQGDEPHHPAWDKPYLGELLIGHRTRADSHEDSLWRPGGVLANGTFQVIRKIELDPVRFAEEAKGPKGNLDAKLVMAKMVGRHKNGDALGGNQGDTEIDYSDGKFDVPLQSHIRRANPREADTPRILRRGFSYGPYAEEATEEDKKRGLMFIAYNASIAEQFEVIQRWISGGNSTGLSSWHGDPLLAPQRAHAKRVFRYLGDDGVVTVAQPRQPVALLKWGIYAFAPSRHGLQLLSAPAQGDTSENGADTVPSEIPTRENPTKLRLENTDEHCRDKREAYWVDIRKQGACEADSYGVLVGTDAAVREILRNENEGYSTCEYMRRMKNSIGEQYLGLDAGDRYNDESGILKDYLQTLTKDEMRASAYEVAKKALKNLTIEVQSEENDGEGNNTYVKPRGKRFEGEKFIAGVTSKLAAEWFGLPLEEFQLSGVPKKNRLQCPHDFLASSFYVFGPDPTDFVADNAQKKGRAILAALEPHFAANAPQPAKGLMQVLRNHSAKDQTGAEIWTSRKKAEYLAGVSFGFFGPTTGSFRSVLFDWIKEQKLWRLHQRVSEMGDRDHDRIALLRKEILKSMAVRPIPDLLHRRAAKDMNLSGIEVQEDQPIVFSIRSAIADGGDHEALLFGGDYNESDPPMHACPGKDMAICTLVGCFMALFEQEQLKPRGPLSLWLLQA